MNRSVNNPILPGFHPDPAICRKGDTYYIANSTFHWFPGVVVHYSKDLVEWKSAGCILDSRELLDLSGVEDHGGVWAPCLTLSGERFYLIFSIVRSWTGPYKDVDNYLTTAEDIKGPWSKPVFLNKKGFDPSMFHDEDGRKWLLNAEWDYRPGKDPFAGIVIQEYSEEESCLKGDPERIYKGSGIGMVEGPHLYKKDGYYYLLTAEGGTTRNHASTIARSSSIKGPYTTAPEPPLLTSSGHPELELQRSGHGSLVQTQHNEWYIAHLCGRPVKPQDVCILGRESALQKLTWPEGGWPSLSHGKNTPLTETEAPAGITPKIEEKPKPRFFRDDFNSSEMDTSYSTLREPLPCSAYSLTARPGFLRLYGGDSLYSLHRQRMIAKRIQDFYTEAYTGLDFRPESFHHTAGLILYYDSKNYYYLKLSENNGKKTLSILSHATDEFTEHSEHDLSTQNRMVTLKARLNCNSVQFFFSESGNTFRPIGPCLGSEVLGDEYKCETKFTGAFAGICVQDLAGTGVYADFDYFELRSVDP